MYSSNKSRWGEPAHTSTYHYRRTSTRVHTITPMRTTIRTAQFVVMQLNISGGMHTKAHLSWSQWYVNPRLEHVHSFNLMNNKKSLQFAITRPRQMYTDDTSHNRISFITSLEVAVKNCRPQQVKGRKRSYSAIPGGCSALSQSDGRTDI